MHRYWLLLGRHRRGLCLRRLSSMLAIVVRQRTVAALLPTNVKPELTPLPWLGKVAALGVEVTAAWLVGIGEGGAPLRKRQIEALLLLRVSFARGTRALREIRVKFRRRL